MDKVQKDPEIHSAVGDFTKRPIRKRKYNMATHFY
jgi:hypothetical protein